MELKEVEIEGLFKELIDLQDKKILKFARSRIPYLTADDVLQPNDFPELENDAEFRYEEGVKEGLLTALVAWRAALREKCPN